MRPPVVQSFRCPQCGCHLSIEADGPSFVVVDFHGVGLRVPTEVEAWANYGESLAWHRLTHDRPNYAGRSA